MDDQVSCAKPLHEESGTTHVDANMPPRESSQDMRHTNDMKASGVLEKKDETTSLKRERDFPIEASDSSLDDNERDEAHDGVPSTDTSATNLGVQGGDGGGITDQMRLEERRAYNRRNAARSRQRVKDQLRDLQQQVIAHTTTRSELERTNVRLLAENNVLRDEVHKLRTILSGAPLFGQQQQTLQPFLQPPYQVGLDPTAQFLTQGASQPAAGRTFPPVMAQTAQPTSQMVLPNATTGTTQQQQQQQQGPFGFFPLSAQNQMQQVPNASASSFSMNQQQLNGQSVESTNNQNAVVQLLLQQIMNTTGNSNSSSNTAGTQLSNTNGSQEAALQLQQQQSPQQQENSFAALMALVGGTSNSSVPSVGEGTAPVSQQHSTCLGSPSDGQILSASTATQNTYPSIRPQQLDQLNIQEMQQSFLSQQQQQYEIKHEDNRDE